MFDILVYLYETYQRPDACLSSVALVKKLAAFGFEEDEIAQAITWLTGLAKASDDYAAQQAGMPTQASSGTRVYADCEIRELGITVIGFIQFLEAAKIINSLQREIVIERALAASEQELSLEKLKVIVLMVLWSQGKEPDGLIFDQLFADADDLDGHLLH